MYRNTFNEILPSGPCIYIGGCHNPRVCAILVMKLTEAPIIIKYYIMK